MINRFKEIKGIGKFDTANLGSSQFGRNTIVFGRNTLGKSTITDIIRSWKTGDSSVLVGRKRFGCAAAQKVVLVDADKKEHVFPSKAWEEGNENIEIFDTKFIDENIFVGNEVSFDQQKRLNSIIVGTKGQALSAEIEQLHQRIVELTRNKTEGTKTFNLGFNKAIAIEECDGLEKPEDPNILLRVRERLERVDNREKLSAAFDVIDGKISRVLNQHTKAICSEMIQAKADLVAQHIERTWRDPQHSRDFLQTGLVLTKDDASDCVFCGQELGKDATELLKAYSDLFTAEYTKVQASINEAVDKYLTWDPVDSITRFPNELAPFRIVFDISGFDLDDIKLRKQNTDQLLKEKARNVAFEVDFADFDSIIETFQSLKVILDELRVEFLEKETDSKDIVVKEIQTIEFAEKRHLPEWIESFERRNKDSAEQEEKTKLREAKRQELQEYSEGIFSLHLDTINRVLKLQNADFELVNFSHMGNLVGKKERLFKIRFFGDHLVDLSALETGVSNFGNSLSDSDKRVLAFAFFYSLLIHDDNLDKKLVVLDDPFSSYDNDRRFTTVNLLTNLYITMPDKTTVEKKYRQLIVLTHELEYFKTLCKSLETPTALELHRDGDDKGVKRSTYKRCDFEQEYLTSPDVLAIQEIQIAASGAIEIKNFDDLCTKARKILESVYKRKYYASLAIDNIVKTKGPRTFIATLGDAGIGGYDDPVKFKAFDALCVSLNIELHDGEVTNSDGNEVGVLSHFLTGLPNI